MKFWFFLDTMRVAKERAAVEALVSNTGWFSLQRWSFHQGRFCAEGTIRVRGTDYPVRLVYPDQFPEVPAWVEPQDPNAKWSSHQYGAGGVLCLELRPDNWVEMAIGADVLESAFRLLDIENPLGNEEGLATAPSAGNVGSIQSYSWFTNPFFISAGCAARLQAGVATEPRAMYSSYFDGILPVFVHDAVDRAGGLRPPCQGGFAEFPIFVSTQGAPRSRSMARDDLLAATGLPEGTTTLLSVATSALVLFTGDNTVRGFHLVGDGPAFQLDPIIMPETRGHRSGRAPAATMKRVAIVGAGSVGSKLAECLLRSGVHRLLLIDGDIMLPANLERQALDWRDVGFRKVKALKRRLLNIVPDADIVEISDNLNWQRSARTHAWQTASFAECDVIVDATGDVPTALFLGAIAAANGRPFVSIEVFEGGIGALVASCVPKRDPPYGKARAAFMTWCDTQGASLPESAGRPYESLSDEGTPLVADDAAVTMAAGHGARVIIDIIDGNPAERNAAWLLIGFQRQWIFDGHGHTRWISVGAPNEPESDRTDPQAFEFVAALLEDALSESGSSE